MTVDALVPAPAHQTRFAWSHHKTVPAVPGCYVIANYHGEVLYVGLAKTSIRDRMGVHLDTPAKRAAGPHGVGFWFHYLPRLPENVAQVERGWTNQAMLNDGQLPPLNKVHGSM